MHFTGKNLFSLKMVHYSSLVVEYMFHNAPFWSNKNKNGWWCILATGVHCFPFVSSMPMPKDFFSWQFAIRHRQMCNQTPWSWPLLSSSLSLPSSETVTNGDWRNRMFSQSQKSFNLYMYTNELFNVHVFGKWYSGHN